MVEIEPFSEFGWKNWKTISFSPALVGKARILVLGQIMINSIIKLKAILSRNRIKEGKIAQYHMGQALFHQVDPRLEAFPMFCQGGW